VSNPTLLQLYGQHAFDPFLFQSVSLGEKGTVNISAIYFSTLVGPPALVPLYFQWYIFYFVVQRKQWVVSQLRLADGDYFFFDR